MRYYFHEHHFDISSSSTPLHLSGVAVILLLFLLLVIIKLFLHVNFVVLSPQIYCLGHLTVVERSKYW